MEYIGKHEAVKIDFGGGSSTRIIPIEFLLAIQAESGACTTVFCGELFFTQQELFYLEGETKLMHLVNQFSAFNSEIAALREVAGGDR